MDIKDEVNMFKMGAGVEFGAKIAGVGPASDLSSEAIKCLERCPWAIWPKFLRYICHIPLKRG